MAQLDSKLIKLAFQAVREPKDWRFVLQHILSVTPAKAAIITLRDKKTCQIINDDHLENEYHSPLIQGFPTEAVMYYLNELRTIDPWAEAQKTHYPFYPTLMSMICHPQKAKDRRFFDWLEQGGLRDTVVFELERNVGFWTAINLFLEHYESHDGKKLLDYCRLHQDILQEAWQSSQYVLKFQQSGYAVLNYLTSRSIPACIITSNGEVFLANEDFNQFQKQENIKILRPSGRLSVCENTQIFGLEDVEVIPLARHFGEQAKHNIFAYTFEPDPMYREKKDSYWLLSFNEGGSVPKISPEKVFQLDILTDQERELLEAISQGNNIQHAGKSIGLQRSRTFDVWANVKSKLGISNSHELRGILTTFS